MSFKLDRVTALDITAVFADDKNKCYPRKIHITQIPNATVKGLDNYSDQIKSCESFVNDKPIGFISEVNEERVTCYLWDRYVRKLERMKDGFPFETEFHAISVEV